MESYIKLYNDLSNVLKHQDNKEFVNTLLEYFNYSGEFKKTIFTNPELSLKIINRYKNITEKFIEFGETLENLLIFFKNKIVNKTDTKEKKIFVQIDTEIYKYFQEQNFFQKCYDEKEICNIEITKKDIIDYKKLIPAWILQTEKFELRKNQLEVKKHLETIGMITGIHLEATGCGKTIEILMYIDFAYKKNPYCKIILFTERINILADLFDFEKKINPIDLENIKIWKDKGICDLTKFEIIDRVTVKKSDWIEILNKSNKPTLLVINRAYLTQTKEYEKIIGLDLILHDECHNVASNKCFEFLNYFKSKEFKSETNTANISCSSVKNNHKVSLKKNNKFINQDKVQISYKKKVPIVGFSATPLRAGKTKTSVSTVLNKDRLLEIYGSKSKLNTITNYNMIYAISEKLILPPKFYWFNIDNYQTKGKYDKNIDNDKSDSLNIKEVNKKNNKEYWILVSKSELGSVLKILDELILLMPNKKLVAWCGTIPLCDEWYDKFLEHKDMYENLKNIKIYKDYSKKINELVVNSYDCFKYIESEGIMFCAQKHREGSDIIKLDGCIFLDKVKSRGAIPFIQSIGRVMRKEKSNESKKTCGFVIDGVVRDDEDYEKNIVDKIFGYYFALADLANFEDYISDSNKINTESNYSKYIELRDLVEFDSEEKKIKLKLDKTFIEINCKRLDWNNIVKNFDSILCKKVGLNQEEIIKAEFENLKKIVKKKEFASMNEYFKWAKKKNLENNPKIKYNKYWLNSYDFLGLDTKNYISKNKFKKICIKFDIKDINDLEKIIKNYSNIPYDPCEYYGIKNFKDFIDLKEILIE